jgi:O-antigen/teichoic acid export membrane protein
MSHGKRDVLFKRLAYGWLGSLTLKVCGMILGLVSTILLARYLGVTGYGLYSYAIVLVTLISMPAILGVPTLVTRETARANEARNWGQMRGLWRWSGRISLILVTVALALATSVLYFTNNHIAHADKVVIYIAMMMTPLLVMGRLRSAALRGLKSPVLAQMPEQFIRQTCFLSLIALLVIGLGEEHLTAATAMGLNVISVFFAFLVGVIFLYKLSPTSTEISVSSDEQRNWLRAIVPFAFVSGAQLLLKNTDLFMLGLMKGMDEVGWYRVSVQISLLMVFGLEVITLVVAPYFVRFYKRGDLKKLKRTFIISVLASISVAFPVFLVFVLFGEALIDLAFGKEYIDSYYPLLILAVGQLFNVVVGPAGYLLSMAGFEKDTAKVMVWAAILNVLLNLLLIPHIGMIGAAVSSALCLAIWNIWVVIVLRKRVGISPLGTDSRVSS